MQIQALNDKGALLDDVEVFVNGVPIGRTPNAVVSVSGALWKSYIIKLKCEGYHDVQITAEKELKWVMIVLGFCLFWLPWLWAYGAKELQTVVMHKKVEEDTVSKGSTIQNYQRFIGKTWKDVLKENGLEQYINLFEEQRLTDIDMITSLSEEDLEKMGIKTLGDRKRLIKLLRDT